MTEIYPAITDELYDIMEDECRDKFYIKEKDKPSFLLFYPHSIFAQGKHYHQETKHWTLYLNRVGLIGIFKTKNDALLRLKQIIENANFPVTVLNKDGKVFAENRVQRKELTGNFCRVFEIDEWNKQNISSDKEIV
jgi:hypothetical protein